MRLRWATFRDQGQVRERNQGSVWASEGLLGVAGGFGPAADIDLPSAVALRTLAGTTTAGASAGALHAAGQHATAAVHSLTTAGSDLAGAGTTLTALA